VQQVSNVAESVLPGWLGDRLTHPNLTRRFGQDAPVGQPTCVRVGDILPVPGGTFPVAAPFVGAGHLAIDKDGTDPAVARWLRGILVRNLAALPADQLRVLTVDSASLGGVFAPFRRLLAAGAWPVPATDVAGLRTTLVQAERHVTAGVAGRHQGPAVLIVAAADLPAGISPDDLSRLKRLAQHGPSRNLHLLIAGWPPPGTRAETVPQLPGTTYLTSTSSGHYSISRPTALRRLGGGSGDSIRLDKGPDDDVVDELCRRSLSASAGADRPDFFSVTAKRFWQLSSAAGLTAIVGRSRTGQCTVEFNDETPHMLVGGPTGAGKTNFLLVLLCSLATHYAPDEMAMYLLDFKEGVSFSVFTPSRPGDSWLPHARIVGLYSDREYGLAVLADLAQEMSKRARLFRDAGVTTIESYRRADPTQVLPRLLVVVDEFQVLLADNDQIAREAVSFLERLARQGRSQGIHLVLVSQTLAGIDALNARRDSIFGQFALRVALPGGRGVLQPGNTAADVISIGASVVNSSAGLTDGNLIVQIPKAPHDSVAKVVQALWQSGSAQFTAPPEVFDRSAKYYLKDSPKYRTLAPAGHNRLALIGLAIDVGLPSAGFVMGRVPGRHIAVLGTAPAGADILHAAALSLARQHQPGTARFVILDPAAVAARLVAALIAELTVLQHDVAELDAGYLQSELASLTGPQEKLTYVVAFGMDVAVSMLTERGPNGRTGLDDLRKVLRHGPLSNVHLISWWQGSRRFLEAIGGSAGREDVACLVIMNIPGPDAAALLGDYTQSWHPREDRCLLLDQHDQRRLLVVPFARPDGHGGTEKQPPLDRAS
jgi:S-DNA-T family DNA segregation ATPase FtsK/SpoIIIE